MAAVAQIDKIVRSSIPERVVPAPGVGAIQVRRSGLRSVVTQARATSPLKILTPRNNGTAAWVYGSTYGGGIVDGDHLQLTVDVDDEAAAMYATQASTKVYRSPCGTRSDVTVRVGARALFASLPDPVVCFTDAHYAQRQHFQLDPTASLVHLDWLSCGRRGRGERWAFSRYRSSLRISAGARLICYEALTLASDDGPIAERLDRFDVLATIALVGPECQPRAQALLETAAEMPLTRRAEQLVSVAPIGDGAGCLIRLADVSLERAGGTIRQWLDFLPARLGDDPWARKW